ncbi:diaminopimelate epimerase [Anaeramoeba ignava]|uniref:diaminopimelate epimerase n=1 Tax=Anaeramoeba ignava TaxID=1746090 RepID=A0A9Q0LGZ1_ANAIG|nr:diaminopimelate epimerase [Anaeramoeba ignava]
MEIYNSDGSKAEICGNATRSLAGYLYENQIEKNQTFSIFSNQIQLQVEIIRNNLVKAQLPKPIFEIEKIPVENIFGLQMIIEESFEVEGFKSKLSTVSMGNPHAVFFVEDLEKIDVEKVGYLVENHKMFPNKTNCEFAEIKSENEIKMYVWERGSGRTKACGSGAAAVFAVAVKTNKISRSATVHMEGGDLFLECDENLERIWQTGPYKIICEGFYYYYYY